MTSWRALEGINYPAVLVLVWLAAACCIFVGIAACAMDWPAVGIALLLLGFAMVPLPFLFDPWKPPDAPDKDDQ